MQRFFGKEWRQKRDADNFRFVIDTRTGRNDRIRTCDILVPNQARYQLRYIPKEITIPLYPKTQKCQEGNFIKL